MARGFTCGFEMAENTDGGIWEGASSVGEGANGFVSYYGSIKRSGDYAGLIYPTVGNLGNYTKYRYAAANYEWWLGFGLYIATSHGEASAQPFVVMDDSAGNEVIVVKITSDRKLQLFPTSGGSQIGSDSAQLDLNTWYYIEVHANDYAGGGGELRINGSTVASGTCGNNGLLRFRIGFMSNLTANDVAYVIDDVVLNDNQGTDNNTWPGDSHIIMVQPNADGTYNQGVNGGADSGTTYGQLDENPPNGDTDYYILDSNNDRVSCLMQTASSQGVPSGSTINAVHMWARLRAASGGSQCSFKHELRYSGSVSSNFFAIAYNEAGAPPPYATSGDPTLTGSYYHRQGWATGINPNTSSAWTLAELDSTNFEVGIVANDAAPDVYVTAIWALIDYTPPAAGGAVQDLIQMGIIPFER